MTSAGRKLDVTIGKLFSARKDLEIPAWLGDRSGNIKADDNGNVYVTFWNGETIIVRNHSVPNQQRWVIVGYRNNVLQVLKSWDTFFDASSPDVPEHDHTWGISTNPSWIRKQQILDGLAAPGTGLTIDFLGLEYYLNGAYHVIGYKNIDLTAQIPTSDARWCNVEADEDGVISFNTGGTVKSSRELLLLEDIPATAAAKKLLFSVRTRVGQVSFKKEPSDSDIFVPLFSGVASGGSASSIAWGGIIGTLADQPDLQSELDVKQNLVLSPVDNDIATVDNLGQTKDSGKSFDTDTTFAANSDNKIPTQKAVKTFVETLVAGLGVTWEIITSDQSASNDHGYIANKATLLVITLPTIASVTQIIRIAGMNAGLWKIAQNAGQLIHLGNLDTTTGVGGSLASVHARDAVELICVVANTEWNVISSTGNIMVV
jgi:hypothetical protein